MKKFLIIGNAIAVASAYIGQLLLEGRICYGTLTEVGMLFVCDDGTTRHIGATWYTNLPTTDWQRPFLQLTAHYDPNDPIRYPRYDNHDCILVNHLEDIPCDFYGPMAVPLSFGPKWNDTQFELVDARTLTDKYRHYKSPMMAAAGCSVNGRFGFTRMCIRLRTSQ